ncbi:hypothetical protein [Paracoccus benzoatiresistens]|uniref:Uncharacterized protein n=1 Tax=Paracoccus benzoatiresistens TaxID=2997341 RepID=A0ABT4J7L2_9RHOB|nr:hypothetical protein [Paracoccus sp. EF6]MCZ0963105.1 hypothetical protein [Paracoccus sp. EF6]
MKRFALVAILGLLASPALAWDEETDFRGLHIYTASGDGISATAVCDPDGAFIPPTNHLSITLDGDPLDGEYLIRSSTETHQGKMISGSAVSRDGQDWTGLISVLRSGSQIELTANGKTFRLDTGSPFPVDCDADA